MTYVAFVYLFRKAPASSTASKKSSAGGAGGAGMWRFYTEDSPGIKM